MNQLQKTVSIGAAALTFFAEACAKKQVAVAHPPALQPAVASAVTPKPAAQQSNRVATAQKRPAVATTRSRAPSAATKARIDELLAKIEDAYFDYNRAALRADAVQTLHGDSAELRDILKDYPDYKLRIEGYADERGSAEYNLGLGDKRAQAAKDYLVQVGIPSGQLDLVSYGKERPVCEEHEESCWQRNRRIHILATAQAGH